VVALGQVSAGEVDDDTAAFLVSIRTPALRLAAAPEESP
jgi:hypothetical protein